jgi:hypothetical protein
MQLYQGLPIITNKITDEEKKGIPHHLLGRIGLEHETWTVGKFVSNALDVVCMVSLYIYINTDLDRFAIYRAEASSQFLSVVLTTTLNHSYFKTRFQKNPV